MDISTLFSLEGKVAVITGGSRGIGKHFARAFIDAGCSKVYITARKAQACVETAEELGTRLAVLGAEMMLEGLRRVGRGAAEFTAQDLEKVTHSKKLQKEDGRISKEFKEW